MLREDTAQCDFVSSDATDPDHRQMLAHLAARLRTMIEDVEAAVIKITGDQSRPGMCRLFAPVEFGGFEAFAGCASRQKLII
jgi:hypothetical protein